ncbi:MAG: GTP 3',8-cyclase MoaA [Methanothermobacter thermautotrophicus]|nr:GTP 3',8-cyclase MoaA [Methanothermobacter thermautotrophicus]
MVAFRGETRRAIRHTTDIKTCHSEVKHIQLSHISVSDIITVLTPTCNFRCRYCFFKPSGCMNHPPDRIADRIQRIRDETGVERVLIAGGEPTLQEDLPELTKILAGDFHVTISTNGTRRDVLRRSTFHEVHVDLKALDEEKHIQLTGESNREVLECIEEFSGSDRIEVSTVLVPGFVDLDEIEGIAEFLSVWDVPYRITGYVAHGNSLGARRPRDDEIREAARISRRYLSRVSTSLDFRRHRKRRMIIRTL